RPFAPNPPALRSASSSASAWRSLTESCMSGCGRTSGEGSLTRSLGVRNTISAHREYFRGLGVHSYTTAGDDPRVNAATAREVCQFQALSVVASCGNGPEGSRSRLALTTAQNRLRLG